MGLILLDTSTPADLERPRPIGGAADGRVGEEVAPLAPHSSGRARFEHPVPHVRDSFHLV
jgi:hypothetical protein